MNPQGCRVAAFRQPSPEELAHDFLWRVYRAVPARGEVVIFNRSHYEDVLVVRVHGLVPKHVWSKRYERINAFEKGLVEHDTHILKFYLHISPEEQLERFKARLDDPGKRWKISESDYQERALWDQYTAAYEEALRRCSTEDAPWFVIPSNHKWFRNLAIARIVVEQLESAAHGISQADRGYRTHPPGVSRRGEAQVRAAGRFGGPQRGRQRRRTRAEGRFSWLTRLRDRIIRCRRSGRFEFRPPGVRDGPAVPLTR